MSNNDLMKRGDATAHPFANGQYDHDNANKHFIWGHESYKEWIENLPAVPQLMSAVEFLEAFSRMDGRVLHFVRGCVACGEFDIAVSAAQKWAKEHPDRSEG